jgi:hypothetical protein
MILCRCDCPDCYNIEDIDGAVVVELQIDEGWKMLASINRVKNLSHICTECIELFNLGADDENDEAIEENNPNGFECPYLQLVGDKYSQHAILTWDRNKAYFEDN